MSCSQSAAWRSSHRRRLTEAEPVPTPASVPTPAIIPIQTAAPAEATDEERALALARSRSTV
jgi:hypothetical protein